MALKQILEFNMRYLTICHPGGFLLIRFWLEEEESNQPASLLLAVQALAFRAGKQIYLGGFSGHLNQL